MKTLYLLRHAHALNATPPVLEDHERVLSPQGVGEAQKIGQFMQKHAMLPDLVLSSSSVRASQTARLVLDALFRKDDAGAPSRSDRKLYQASDQKILHEIQKTDPSIRRLMLVGHNPGVSDLAMSLDRHGAPKRFENYAPATLTIFRGDCENWEDFSPDTSTLELVFAP